MALIPYSGPTSALTTAGPIAPSANGRRARRDLRPQFRALLSHGALDGRSLHLALVVHDDTGVVLEVQENAVGAPPSFLLPNDDTFQHLLPQLRLALLACAEDHVARTAFGNHVQTAADAADGHDVQVLRAAVVCAIHQRSDSATQRHLQLAAAPATASALHLFVAVRWLLNASSPRLVRERSGILEPK